MISRDRIMEKLETESKRMKDAVKACEWRKAKAIYNCALSVAVFIEPNYEEYIKIWGNSPYIEEDMEEKPGWFDRETIMKISEKCVEEHIESIMFPMRIPEAIKNDIE